MSRAFHPVKTKFRRAKAAPMSRPTSRLLVAIDGPGREDLLETIALETFLKEGKVFVLPQSEMPNGGPVAAVYRY